MPSPLGIHKSLHINDVVSGRLCSFLPSASTTRQKRRFRFEKKGEGKEAGGWRDQEAWKESDWGMGNLRRENTRRWKRGRRWCEGKEKKDLRFGEDKYSLGIRQLFLKGSRRLTLITRYCSVIQSKDLSLKMDKHPLDSNPNPINQSQSQFPSHTPPVHQMEADDDDENVKQLKECSALYLSLQVISYSLAQQATIFYNLSI